MLRIYNLNTLRCTTREIITSNLLEAKKDNIPCYFVAPESSKASVERLIVSLNCDENNLIPVTDDIKVNASFVNGDAVSFIRLAQRFLQMCGVVSSIGSSKTILRTAIYRILAEHKAEFKTFSKFVGRFEYIDNLIDLLGDFSRYGIDEEKISIACESAGDDLDPVYLDKLYDLKLLSYYISQFNKSYDLKLMVDSMAEANALMKKIIDNPDLLKTRRYREFASVIKSRFVVVGFGAVRLLTPQEIMFVRNMSLLGAELRFFPLTGTDYEGSDIDDSIYENGIKFSNSLVEAVPDATITDFFYDRSLVACKDEVLSIVSEGFAHRIDADKLFAPDEVSKSDAISCVSISGVDDRIGYIANEIMDLTRNKGYRYRDISIVCIDDAVVNRIKSVLSLWGMDSFIDRKIIISNTPVFRYLSLLEVLPIRDYRLEDVLAILRTGLAGVVAEDVDLLENYCVENNIVNGKRFFNQEYFSSDDKYSLKTMRDGKEMPASIYLWTNVIERVLIPIRDVAEEINAVKHLDKKAYLSAQHIDGLKDTVEALAHELKDRGDSDRASALVRGYKEVMELLTGFTLPINNCEISQKDFCSLILIDMRNKVQGTIPLMVDSVDIITMEQAYFFPTKVMFVIGATSENFPYRRVNEGLMTRQELVQLSSDSGVNLPDKVQSRNRSDFVTAGLMLNSVSDKLYLINEYGGEASSVYNYFLKFTKEEKINCFKVPFTGNLVEQRHDFHNASIDPLYMREFIGDGQKVSVSSIETYNTCHMHYMLQYILSLKNREDGRRIKTNVMGTIIHYMFETTLKKFSDMGRTVENYEKLTEEFTTNPEKLEELSVEAFNSYCNQSKKPNEKSQDFFVFPGAKARRIFKYSLPYILREIVSSGFIPDAFERKIEAVEKPLVYTSNLGNTFNFVGSADRVDHSPELNTDRIVDYKSGAKDFDYVKTLAGVQIQLFAYANALKCERNVADVSYVEIGLKPESDKPLEVAPSAAGLSLEDFNTVAGYVDRIIQTSCNGISEGKADAFVNSKSKGGRGYKCSYCPFSGACGNNKSNPELRVEGELAELSEDDVKKITEAKSSGGRSTVNKNEKAVFTMKKLLSGEEE